jgi:hypothetical protein
MWMVGACNPGTWVKSTPVMRYRGVRRSKAGYFLCGCRCVVVGGDKGESSGSTRASKVSRTCSIAYSQSAICFLRGCEFCKCSQPLGGDEDLCFPRAQPYSSQEALACCASRQPSQPRRPGPRSATACRAVRFPSLARPTRAPKGPLGSQRGWHLSVGGLSPAGRGSYEPSICLPKRFCDHALGERAVSLERSTTTTVRKTSRRVRQLRRSCQDRAHLYQNRTVLMEWCHGLPQGDAPEITMACQTRTIVPGKEEDKTIMLIDEG